MPPPRISSSASLRSRRRSTKMSTRSPIASGSRITSIRRRRNYGSPNRRGLDPPMPGRMTHHIDLPGALAILELHPQHVALVLAGGVAHGQRQFLDDVAQRLPDVVESD